MGLLRLAGRTLLRLPRPVMAAACAGWMFLIWSLSTREGSDVPAAGWWPVLANSGHAFTFGILCLLLASLFLRAVPNQMPAQVPVPWPSLNPASVLSLLLAVGAYGILDEWHQSQVPGRAPSAMDVLTDLVGAACVLWIIAYLGRPEADGRGLGWRLLGGVVLCFAVAVLGTLLAAW